MIHQPIQVGHLIKSFGKDGQMRVNLEANFQQDIIDAGYLLVDIEGTKVPYFIEEYSEEQALIKFEKIKGPYEAKPLSDSPVFLLDKDVASVMIQENTLDGTIIGYTLINQEERELGIISNIIELPMQILLEISLKGDGSSHLVPFHESLLLDISEKNKSIQLEIAAGLFEI